jgi:hypothetical protein
MVFSGSLDDSRCRRRAQPVLDDEPWYIVS